jgi:hypothetical protein
MTHSQTPHPKKKRMSPEELLAAGPRRSQLEIERASYSKPLEELSTMEIEAQIEAARVKMFRRKKPIGAERWRMLRTKTIELQAELDRRKQSS